VQALENLERIPSAKRERISDDVRLFVWQRDEGKCVSCGSRERLEFDHIIPFAEGGSSTERNVQLLCEACNRQKGKKI
jgi:5-methylcytosine-specific restriction endonuclease McrA